MASRILRRGFVVVLIIAVAAAGTPAFAAPRPCATPHHHCHDTALTMKCSCGVDVHVAPAAIVDASTQLAGATILTIVSLNVHAAIGSALGVPHVVTSAPQTGPPDLPVRYSSLLL